LTWAKPIAPKRGERVTENAHSARIVGDADDQQFLWDLDPEVLERAPFVASLLRASSHFHAIHGGRAAVFAIEELRVLHGDLPKRAVGLILEWARLHQEELRRNWQLCAEKQTPLKIQPLE